ncbi:hypothetical protein CJF42_01910 [Pseudoalteromonas sp. NBT06-2]|uniref:sensor histidine kinase n=1 Tax=Pseudoalteromonas sp. NBT06-2 TaxID=2025950 RepID=UPI000BA54DAA|nr:histidine kinase [Pseudoalteromonas sp. NBT06-2]PAJ76017.1 hypothetical protein CJF42_01910 [Pseudoalteromonas sp. NBT06-2]
MLTNHENITAMLGLIVSLIKKNGISLLVSVLVVLSLFKLFDTLQPIGDHTASVQKENIFVPIVYLFFYYILFLLLVLSAIYKKNAIGYFSKTLKWVTCHRFAISFVIALGMLPVFSETHYIAWINNLSIALIYALLLLNVVQIAQKKLHPFRLNKTNQRFYLVYALFVTVLFLFIPTVEDIDPYGTRFQLQILCFLMLGHLAFSWLFGQWQLLKELNNQKTEAELMHLKSQVNPHFFFNTLNSLYGLTLEKSDIAPSIILKLSEIMRYSIYQAEKERVPLQSELTYLNNFIQLQQLRFVQRVEVETSIDVDNVNQAIAPLLLINLLENAYKHGVESMSEKSWINLSITLDSGSFTFHLSNNISADKEEVIKAVPAKEDSGLGLRNLTKRLELIYPQKHQLTISNHNEVFDVSLCIQLDEI